MSYIRLGELHPNHRQAFREALQSLEMISEELDEREEPFKRELLSAIEILDRLDMYGAKV